MKMSQKERRKKKTAQKKSRRKKKTTQKKRRKKKMTQKERKKKKKKLLHVNQKKVALEVGAIRWTAALSTHLWSWSTECLQERRCDCLWMSNGRFFEDGALFPPPSRCFASPARVGHRSRISFHASAPASTRI
jgi:hypothetical protein